MKSSDRILNVYVWSVVGFLLIPIFVVVPAAFSNSPSLTFPPNGFSLKWFYNIYARPEFFSAFYLSAQVAVISTAFSLCAGVSASIAFVRYRFPGRNLLLALFMTPLIFPAIVLGAAIALMLSPLGLLRSMWGLTFAHILLTFPYVLRSTLSTMFEIDRSLQEAAYTLGAGKWDAFRHVTLPLLRPGLIAGITFSLIISFDEFTISMFLVGPGVMTLPLEMYHYSEFNIDPTIAAISTILLALTAVVVFIIEKTVGLGKQFS